MTVRIAIALPKRELELANRKAIARWLEQALAHRFDNGTIRVEHHARDGLIITAGYATHGRDLGALTAAAGIAELADQAIELALLSTRPAAVRRALERLFANLGNLTVTVTPDPKGRTA